MFSKNQEDQFLKKLGKKLREVREQKGWTLEDCEDKGYSSWRHLQRVESGKNVTILTLKKVSKLYSISLSDLLRGL